MKISYFFFLLATTSVIGMDQNYKNALQFEYKKYVCCPDKFGYLEASCIVPEWVAVQSNGKPICYTYKLLCPFNETESLDDSSYSFFSCTAKLFMRLVLEVAQRKTPEARKAVEELLQRVLNKKIDLDQRVKITQKDLLHRMLSHLPVRHFSSNTYIYGTHKEELTMLFDLSRPCIHNMQDAQVSYWLVDEEYLLPQDIESDFKKLFKPPLPLVDLASKVVAKHTKKEEWKNLPEELRAKILLCIGKEHEI